VRLPRAGGYTPDIEARAIAAEIGTVLEIGGDSAEF